ncbi:lipopolysaccharide transport periplasmic protein LptA [Ignatzschineria sp. LJL83]
MTNRFKTLLITLPALLAISYFNPALATPEDRKLPLDINADWSEFSGGTPTGIYRGNVVLTQGNLKITADEAIFQLKDGELEYIIATGNPVKIKDLPQVNEAWIFGEGGSLSFYPKKQMLELKTNAKIEQNRDTVSANIITYDLETRKINAERSPDDRVHFTIQMEGRD